MGGGEGSDLDASQGFSRFTPRARNVVGTEHILLGLLEVEDGTGVLAGLGVDRANTEATIAATLAAHEKE